MALIRRLLVSKTNNWVNLNIGGVIDTIDDEYFTLQTYKYLGVDVSNSMAILDIKYDNVRTSLNKAVLEQKIKISMNERILDLSGQ